jgi:hypothetical protein
LRRPSQELKSPTTETERALGAQTAKLVPALPDEVRVELAERRGERVRIALRERVPVRVRDLELVAKRQVDPFHDALEEPVARRQQLDRRALLRVDDDPRRLGPVRPDDDAPVPEVGAEVRVRVVELQAQSGVSSSRRIPATGIPTQSGRLLSS